MRCRDLSSKRAILLAFFNLTFGMHFFVVCLITLRVVFCPLFCGVESLAAPQHSGQHQLECTTDDQIVQSCCHHCSHDPIPAPKDDCPKQSCPDCDCFCSESVIVGLKVDLEDLSPVAWGHFVPAGHLLHTLPNQRCDESRNNDRLFALMSGRSMRLTFASLLI